MKTRLLSLILSVIFMSFSAAGFSNGTVKGKIVDSNTGESLIGASVVLDGSTKNGTVSDFDGSFKLSLPSGSQKIDISFIGYISKTINVKVAEGQVTDLGTVSLDPDAIGIDEISVFASMAIQRKTPVALSTIDASLVEEKIGTQELPEILESTPSIYATREGGGYGDSRFNLRGFSSENIAVMINGVPVNDMEWGGVYWSNWMGMSDVLRSLQIQRGLGASKVAVPSVGGSVNIVTKTTDAEKGGSFSTAYGDDGYQKITFSVSSGLMPDGWAFSLFGAKTWGDGYVQGTEFEGYSYFFNLSKRFNDHHTISFTGFGAPQWHNQRSSYDKFTISGWQQEREKYRFNATYGFGAAGERVVSAKNFYHKPQFQFNDFWTINENSSLSTSIYYSFGNGGGYTQLGNEKSKLYGTSGYRTIEGYKDYAAIEEENAANLEGSQAIVGSSNNNHQWYGAISTFTTKFSPNLDFYGGIDLRYYIGKHNRTVENLLGGNFFIDPARENVAYQADNDDYINQKMKVGDIVSRNYDGHVLWEGGFAQAEYNLDKINVYLSGALSNTTYWRYDRMYYAPGNRKSDNVSFQGWSGKGGANYNINDRYNVYANIGYFSRAPYFSSVFLADDVSNEINKDAKNEKVFSAELGYGYKSRFLNVNLNVYNTLWKDKSLAGTIDSQDQAKGTYNATGVNAIHRGVELEAKAKLSKILTLSGMLSIGDWKWDKDVTAYVFNSDGQLVDSDGNVVSSIDDADKIFLNIGGVHVGDAAQTNAQLGFEFKVISGLKIGMDYFYNARLYADPGSVSDLNGSDTWKVPGAGIVKANAVYDFKINGLKASIRGNVENLFNKTYISDADAGSSNTWEDATVFYGFGRTGSVALKIYF